MARDRDGVYREARDFLLRSEELDRKADLAVVVHEADVAYHQAVQRLSAAYEAALEGGWSPAQLDALGFSRPSPPAAEPGPPIRIVRRPAAIAKRKFDGDGRG